MANQLIHSMIDAALDAADPEALVTQHLNQTAITADELIVISVGKAAVAMAQAACKTLQQAVRAGVVVSKLPPSNKSVQALPNSLQYFQGSHPVPDKSSMIATEAVRDLLTGNSAEIPILCLISGGASALLTAPQVSTSPLAGTERCAVALWLFYQRCQPHSPAC